MRYSAAMLFLSAIISAAGADAKPRFAETPKAMADFKSGIADGLRCALGYTIPPQISQCAFAMARVNARDGSDTRAYNLGLTLETWRDLDVDWTTDQALLKSHQVTAAAVHDEETATAAMYQLYRGSRDALGLSDMQAVALTTLTPKGKAVTLTRLQFWAKRTQ